MLEAETEEAKAKLLGSGWDLAVRGLSPSGRAAENECGRWTAGRIGEVGGGKQSRREEDD